MPLEGLSCMWLIDANSWFAICTSDVITLQTSEGFIVKVKKQTLLRCAVEIDKLNRQWGRENACRGVDGKGREGWNGITQNLPCFKLKATSSNLEDTRNTNSCKLTGRSVVVQLRHAKSPRRFSSLSIKFQLPLLVLNVIAKQSVPVSTYCSSRLVRRMWMYWEKWIYYISSRRLSWFCLLFLYHIWNDYLMCQA